MDDEGLLDRLAEDLAAVVANRYRIREEEAVAAILGIWSRRPALVEAARRAVDSDDLKRQRVYREAADAAKKDVYNKLRRYRSQQNAADSALALLTKVPTGAPKSDWIAASRAVAAAHISTAERLPHLAEFYERLTGLIGSPCSVLDVGSGVLPLVVPFDGEFSNVSQYWALEKDAPSIAAIRELARIRDDGRLHPLLWDLAEGWPAAHAQGMPQRFEIGFLLKVVPVVARHSDTLPEVLAATPADRLLVSGSRIAMAKHQDIERREVRLLRRFFGEYDLKELASFRTPDEIAFLVERA